MNNYLSAGYKTNFSEFADYLFGIIRGDLVQSRFVRLLFQQIVKKDSVPQGYLKGEDKLETFKGYYHGTSDITVLSASIYNDVSEEQFAKFISSYSEFTKKALVEDYPWHEDEEVTVDNIGALIANRFGNIIRQAAASARRTSRKAIQHDTPADMKSPYGEWGIYDEEIRPCEKPLYSKRALEACNSFVALSENDQKVINDFAAAIVPCRDIVAKLSRDPDFSLDMCADYLQELKLMWDKIKWFTLDRTLDSTKLRKADNQHINHNIGAFASEERVIVQCIEDRLYYKRIFLDTMGKMYNFSEDDVQKYTKNYLLCSLTILDSQYEFWEKLKKHTDENPLKIPSILLPPELCIQTPWF